MADILRYDAQKGIWIREEPLPSRSFGVVPATGGLVALAALGISAIALGAKPPRRVGLASTPPAIAIPAAKPGEEFSEQGLVLPQYGQIRLGAYAGEAARVAGLFDSATVGLSDTKNYELYRRSVHFAYGVDLEDMNYFSVGSPGWESRLPALQKWILSAGRFGDVTIALEPDGPEKFDVFRDSAGMTALHEVFEKAEEEGIIIWVRFGSEANLQGSPYSVFASRRKAVGFYRRALWFKSNMPGNIRLVFSPLINTVVAGWKYQSQTIEWMFLGDETTEDQSCPWDRIGGTLYRTNLPIEPMYSRYYDLMSEMNPNLRFQLCELGGPYSRRGELISFIKQAAGGKWMLLDKVNLFAREINRRADPSGSFGYMNPNARHKAVAFARSHRQPRFTESYLKVLLSKQTLASVGTAMPLSH